MNETNLAKLESAVSLERLAIQTNLLIQRQVFANGVQMASSISNLLKDDMIVKAVEIHFEVIDLNVWSVARTNTLTLKHFPEVMNEINLVYKMNKLATRKYEELSTIM
jgi:hypothetical protein